MASPADTLPDMTGIDPPLEPELDPAQLAEREALVDDHRHLDAMLAEMPRRGAEGQDSYRRGGDEDPQAYAERRLGLALGDAAPDPGDLVLLGRGRSTRLLGRLPMALLATMTPRSFIDDGPVGKILDQPIGRFEEHIALEMTPLAERLTADDKTTRHFQWRRPAEQPPTIKPVPTPREKGRPGQAAKALERNRAASKRAKTARRQGRGR